MSSNTYPLVMFVKEPNSSTTPLMVPFSVLPSLPKTGLPLVLIFLVKFPLSNDFSTVIVFCDRRSKRAHFIACSDDLDGFDFAQIFMEEIFRLHGLPTQIISDRGTQFVNAFQSRLFELLHINHTPSTAFHQRTNGQAERTIQTLEAFLRCYTDYMQDDWHAWLPLAEFAYNNLVNTSTGVSPFEADGVINPRFNFHFDVQDSNDRADQLIVRRKQVQEEIDAAITHAQETQAKYFDRHVKEMPEFQVGQQVMLLRRNISTNRPAKKLDYTRLGPFRVTAVDARNVTLDLGPNERRLHNVFHVSLIEPYRPPALIQDRIESQIPHAPELDTSVDIVRILNSRKLGRGVSYLVLRQGQQLNEATWENYKDLKDNLEVLNLILRFHFDNPNKPKAPQLTQVETELVAAPQEQRGPSLRQDQRLKPLRLVRDDGGWQKK